MGTDDQQGISEFAEVIDGVLVEPADIDSIYEGFDKLTPTERKIMSKRGTDANTAKRKAKKLAEMEAWAEAHREVAGEIFAAKMDVFRSLVKEGTDPETGEFKPKLLGEKNIKNLLSFAEQIEKSGFASQKKSSETTNTVNVLAIMSDLKKSIGS